MLWVVFNISWQEHVINKQLDANLPEVSDKLKTQTSRSLSQIPRAISDLMSYGNPPTEGRGKEAQLKS